MTFLETRVETYRQNWKRDWKHRKQVGARLETMETSGIKWKQHGNIGHTTENSGSILEATDTRLETLDTRRKIPRKILNFLAEKHSDPHGRGLWWNDPWTLTSIQHSTFNIEHKTINDNGVRTQQTALRQNKTKQSNIKRNNQLSRHRNRPWNLESLGRHGDNQERQRQMDRCRQKRGWRTRMDEDR